MAKKYDWILIIEGAKDNDLNLRELNATELDAKVFFYEIVEKEQEGVKANREFANYNFGKVAASYNENGEAIEYSTYILINESIALYSLKRQDYYFVISNKV